MEDTQPLPHRAQLFHNWRFIADASPRAQMSDLLHVTRGWLQTDVSTLSILDKVVLDRLLRALLHDMNMAASHCMPQTLEGLLEAVETNQNTQARLSRSRAESATRSRSRKDSPTAVYPEPTVGRAKGPQNHERWLG
jgi:hypothetical protein